MKAPVGAAEVAAGVPLTGGAGSADADTIQTTNRSPSEDPRMADITMFELHFHDDIGLGRPAAGGDVADDDARSSGDTDADEEASSGSGLGRIVVALAAVALLVLLGVGAKKLLSDDLEPIEELEGLDEEE